MQNSVVLFLSIRKNKNKKGKGGGGFCLAWLFFFMSSLYCLEAGDKKGQLASDMDCGTIENGSPLGLDGDRT